MKKIITIISLVFASVIFAQQDPHYTHYMYNQNVVNPAYATDNLGVINFGAMHRSQWVNATGAPKTYNFFVHAPISSAIELGLSVITGNIGDGVLKENNIYADFSYILEITKGHKLALGLKAGITNFATNFSNFRFPDEDIATGFIPKDNAFDDNISRTLPNFGTGAFYFTDKYYFGIAVPNLLNSTHLVDKNGITSLGGEEIHLFVNGGYVYQLNDLVKLKPSFMTKIVQGSPVVLDISMNAMFNDKVEGGLSYRLNDSASAMFNIRALATLRIGYAFDFTVSELNTFNSGTHEIMLLFDFDTLDLSKGYDKSPRFF